MFNLDDSFKAQQKQYTEQTFINGMADGRTFVIDINHIHDIDYITGCIAGLNAWRNELVRQQQVLETSDDCPF